MLNPLADITREASGRNLGLSHHVHPYFVYVSKKWYDESAGLFPAIWGKGPWPKLGKNDIHLTLKLGEINDIEHNKGGKIYP